jgi:hypothetical protein
MIKLLHAHLSEDAREEESFQEAEAHLETVAQSELGTVGICCSFVLRLLASARG